MIRDLLQNCGQLLYGWWKVDRIRIATTTGRLLQLVPGDRLLIREHLLIVRQRSVLHGSIAPDTREDHAAGVEYRLVDLLEHTVEDAVDHADKVILSAGDEWRLQILLPKDSHPCIHRLWIRKAVEELLEEEIVVLRSA